MAAKKQVLAPTPLDPGVIVTMQVNKESTQYAGWQENRMDDFALMINLDDYR